MLFRSLIVVLVASLSIGGFASDLPRSRVLLERDVVYPVVRTALSRETAGSVVFGPDDLIVPSVLAVSTTPALNVSRVLIDEPHKRIEVRVRCATNQCLPFVVFVVPRVFPAKLNRHPENVVSSAAAPEERRRSLLPLAHVGQMARLFMAGEGIRISMVVRCLDSGKAGQTIRVRDTTSGKIYRAEVKPDGVLHAAGVLQ